MRIKTFARKLLILFLLVFCLLSFTKSTVLAQDCDQKFDCGRHKEEDTNEYMSCLDKEKSCWESKITEAKAQANTLQSAINILNGQIQLQSLKIQQTINEIYQLEKEIDELSQRIEGLSISLDKLSGILIERVRASYKQSRTQFKANFFVSNSFNQFISQYRYLNQAQEQTLEVMRQTELQRATYDQQKRLKEEKQEEVNQKKNDLERQKVELDVQKGTKDQLLTETQNSELVYQRKISELNAQLASFSRFASSIGVSLLSDQTRCDDKGRCYYSQRDSSWGNMYLPLSNYTIAQAGCLMTSVAMISTYYGKSLTPAQIAASSSPFASGGGLRYDISVNGVTITRSSACGSSSCLDSVLSEGKPVIVKISAASVSGSHFVVLLEKKDGKYIMHDPVIPNGNNKNFADHYSLSSITRVDRVSVR